MADRYTSALLGVTVVTANIYWWWYKKKNKKRNDAQIFLTGVFEKILNISRRYLFLQLHVAEELNYQCFKAFLHDRNEKKCSNSKAVTDSEFSKSPGMPQLWINECYCNAEILHICELQFARFQKCICFGGYSSFR